MSADSRRHTYAAVAPKISDRFALVTMLSSTAKAAVNTKTMVSLAEA